MADPTKLKGIIAYPGMELPNGDVLSAEATNQIALDLIRGLTTKTKVFAPHGREVGALTGVELGAGGVSIVVDTTGKPDGEQLARILAKKPFGVHFEIKSGAISVMRDSANAGYSERNKVRPVAVDDDPWLESCEPPRDDTGRFA